MLVFDDVASGEVVNGMKPKRKKRNVRSMSGSLAAEFARKKSKIQQIEELIAQIDQLMAKATGSRYFNYKLRRHQAKLVIARLKRSMRSKGSRSGKTPYVVNPKATQGGAPGLVQQR